MIHFIKTTNEDNQEVYFVHNIQVAYNHLQRSVIYFLRYNDIISSIHLSGAANQLFMDHLNVKGIQTINDELYEKHGKKVFTMFRFNQNFLKHSEGVGFGTAISLSEYDAFISIQITLENFSRVLGKKLTPGMFKVSKFYKWLIDDTYLRQVDYSVDSMNHINARIRSRRYICYLYSLYLEIYFYYLDRFIKYVGINPNEAPKKTVEEFLSAKKKK